MSDRIAVMNRGARRAGRRGGDRLRAAGHGVRRELHGRVQLLRGARPRGRRGGASRSISPGGGGADPRERHPVPAVGRRPVRRPARRSWTCGRATSPATVCRRSPSPSRNGSTRASRRSGSCATTADERFVVYEQNEKPFEESSRFAVGSRLFVCWNPKHAVMIRKESGRRERPRNAARGGRAYALGLPDLARAGRLLPPAAGRPLPHQLRPARDLRRTEADRGPLDVYIDLGQVPGPVRPVVPWHLPADLLAVDLDGRRDDRPLPRSSAIRSRTTSRSWLRRDAAQPAARPRRRAVLDELPHPHLRLDVHPADRRARQQAAHGLGPDLAAARASLQRLLGPARSRLRRAAVHDPAALRLAREARPLAARGVGGPRGAAADPPSGASPCR